MKKSNYFEKKMVCRYGGYHTFPQKLALVRLPVTKEKWDLLREKLNEGFYEHYLDSITVRYIQTFGRDVQTF